MSTRLPLSFPVTDSQPNAKLTLSIVEHPSNSIYLLSFSSPPDNRLTPSFLQAWLLALDYVEKNLPNTSVLITTSEITKFWSNGFNLDLARSTDGFWHRLFNPLMIKLLTFPIPTIALMNGHTFAAGFMTAMAHDYRVMNGSRGWCCLNEVELGAELSPGMASIFSQKLSNAVFRSILLEGQRFTGSQAKEAGIADAIGGLSEAIDLIEQKKLIGKGATGVYAQLRDEMYRETIRLLQQYCEVAGTQRDDSEKRGLPRWSKL